MLAENNLEISGELVALVVMSLLYLFAWLPTSVLKHRYFGVKWLASNREDAGVKTPPVFGRLDRAYNNLKENFPPFAVAVLLVLITKQSSTLTTSLAWIFVIARIVHMIAYGLGNVAVRALSWMIGLAVTVGLLVVSLI